MTDDEIIAEARARFARCADWESENRARLRMDLEFYGPPFRDAEPLSKVMAFLRAIPRALAHRKRGPT